MRVYFGETYWRCLKEKAGEVPGREIRTETAFVWEGRPWRVPAVYLCKTGLVIDFCGKVSPQEMIDLREESFHVNFRIEAKVNGVCIQRRMGCGSSYYPPNRIEEEAVPVALNAVEEQLMETYGLDRTAGWVFWRSSFAWPKERPKEIRSIDLTIEKEPVDLPGPHFWTGPKENGKEVELLHPVTGNIHRLTVLGQEPATLQVQEFPPEFEIERVPEHYVVMHYQVEPELCEKELLISDCAVPDQAVRRCESLAASSVSDIIGHADGPTSVFLLGKAAKEKNGSIRKSVSSAPHYELVETIEWRTTFRVNENQKIHVSIQNLAD